MTTLKEHNIREVCHRRMVCEERYEWRRKLKHGWFPTFKGRKERLWLKLRQGDCCASCNLGECEQRNWNDCSYHQVDGCGVHGVHMVQGVHLGDKHRQETYETTITTTLTGATTPTTGQMLAHHNNSIIRIEESHIWVSHLSQVCSNIAALMLIFNYNDIVTSNVEHTTSDTEPVL